MLRRNSQSCVCVYSIMNEKSMKVNFKTSLQSLWSIVIKTVKKSPTFTLIDISNFSSDLMYGSAHIFLVVYMHEQVSMSRFWNYNKV